MSATRSQFACGYVRGSTDEQRDTLTAQAEEIARYADFKGMYLTRPEWAADDAPADVKPVVFVDAGTSATIIPFYEREVASRMVEWMVAKEVGHLVISKLDRGFRNALDCLFTVTDLEQKGIHVHLLDLQVDTSSAVGTLVLTVMAGLAEFESKRRAERQRDVIAVRKANNRRCGHAPYGWMLADAKSDRLVSLPSEQEILYRLVKGDLKDLSANEAARRLNAASVPSKEGGQWYGVSVARIRRNSKLADPMEEAAVVDD